MLHCTHGQLLEHACVAVMANTTLPPLPNNLPFWRIAKLPVAEIRQCLEEAELQTMGTKSQLVRWLHDHLGSLAADSVSDSVSSPSAGRSTLQASPPVSDDQVNSPRRGLPRRHRCSRRHMRSSASGDDDRRRPFPRHGRSQTHSHSHCLATEDGHHHRHHRRRSRASFSPETRCESRSRSYTTSTSASSTSPSSSNHTGRSSSSSSSRAMSPSPLRGHQHRRPT